MFQIEDAHDTAAMMPYVITPEQYYDRRRGDGAMLSIKQLMRAVLTDALRCWELFATAPTERRHMRFAETEAWFFESAADGPFAFATIAKRSELSPVPCARLCASGGSSN
jgi:hypothetical protein